MNERAVMNHAFGVPGRAPTWSSSDKDFVTTALGPARLWATIGHGVINEVFWPSTGKPQIRDLTFYLVGKAGFVDLKRERRYSLATPASDLPLLTVVHTGSDYRLAIEIVPDPVRDVLLVRFELEGPYELAIILAPHLDGTGAGNTAWVEGSALFAKRGDSALALLADVPLVCGSAGFLGASDGWQDLARHGDLRWSFARADGGTVALAPGRPSGSAMPLLWTHAEYLKLLVARDRGKPIELLKAIEDRYSARRPSADTWHWRAEAPFARLARGRRLVIEHRGPFVLRFGFDGWQRVAERTAVCAPFGLWNVAFLPEELEADAVLHFTRRFDGVWEGVDYQVTPGHAEVVHALTHQES